MTPPENIYQALNELMGRVGYVQKEKSRDLPYSFAGETAFIQAVRPHMVELGVILYQSGCDLLERNEFTSKSGTPGINLLARYYWTWLHAPSGTMLICTSVGEASDYGDKAANKSMTAALKYAMRQTLVIETGDDPDKTPSSEYTEQASGTTYTAEQINQYKQWLIAEKVIPGDAHDKHVVALMSLAPFGPKVLKQDLIGWGKMYRYARDDGASAADAAEIATERWFEAKTEKGE